jgi:hypothetical protein
MELFSTTYFSFTKSKTKIAHTPTVIGNCANSASRMELPLGSRKLNPNIAKAVSIPRANLVLEFMVLFYLTFQARPGCKLDGGSLATSIIIAKSAECNSFRVQPTGPTRLKINWAVAMICQGEVVEPWQVNRIPLFH